MDRVQRRTRVVRALAVWCVLAAAGTPARVQAQEQSVRGVVQRVVYQRVQVKTTAGRIYDAEVSGAVLQRKNGLAMELSELRAGDVVELAGSVWSDNSMTVTRLRNVSLHPHSATFTGKVVEMDLGQALLRFHTTAYGEQQAHIGPTTTIQVKGATSSISSIAPGMSVIVKGTWERSRNDVVARSIVATYRLLNITIVGEVVGQVGSDLTVAADGLPYAVHVQGVSVRGMPAGQPLTWLMGRRVRVTGKHRAESLELVATTVRVMAEGR